MLPSVILLIAAATAKADVREPPYEPSGWKPSGAVFLLPTRNHATAQQLNGEQLPPSAQPPSTVNFTPGTIFSTSSNPIPDRPTLTVPPNRQFIPIFRVPPASTPDSFPLTTPTPTPASDHRPSVYKDRNNLSRNNPDYKDNQPFVHKLESVLSLVRPLQDTSRSDDPTLFHNQNQSQLPKQYLPSPASNYETIATFTGPTPQADKVAQVTSYSPNVSAGDEFTYEAPLFDESSASDQQSSYVSSSDKSKLYAQRIFLFVLPVRQATSTGAESLSKLTQGYTFSSGEQLEEKPLINEAPLIRSPRGLPL